MWSIGVIAYVLLSGVNPTLPKNGGEISFQEPQWDQITETGKDFVKKILVIDPNSRLSVQKALNHPWILNPDRDEPLDDSFQNLKITTMSRKLLKNLNAVNSAHSFRSITGTAQRRE